jgi:hypothetical protein
MTAPQRLEKAELRELDADHREEINREQWAKLQFNPETLKVAFANQIQTPSGGDRSGTPSRQFVGAGTTKLGLTLFFDASAPLPEGETAVDDVRRLTKKVAYFITPKEESDAFVPPAVRFVWGSFQFDGMMDGMEETLEFFSSEGKPLRASVTISLSQQRITPFAFRGGGGGGGGRGPRTPGTRPLAEASLGATVQGLATQAGLGDQWQRIASANGIENPRHLQPGQLLNLDIR